MSVIENFSALSEKERLQFADALLKTLNTEQTFSSEIKFQIDRVVAYDIDGSLGIEIKLAETVEVPREASWSGACYCSRDGEDDELDNISGANYANNALDDIHKVFKAEEAVIEGYKVVLDITDYDEVGTTDIEVDTYSHEDSGIGSYEYGDERGYDSHPYVEVEGTITAAYELFLTLFVEPIDAINESFEDPDDLPASVEVKKADLADWDDAADDLDKEEILSDYLSDTFGFLHNGFSYEETAETVKLSDIDWEIDE